MAKKIGLKREDLFGLSKSETWEGEVALITGATSGIGKEIAKVLAKAGLKIFATGRNEKKLKDLKKEIESLQGTIEIKATDLRKEKEIFKLFDAIRGIWGGVRILINNAELVIKWAFSKKTLSSGGNARNKCFSSYSLRPTGVADMRRLGDRGYVINLCSMADTESLPKVVCILRQSLRSIPLQRE